MFDVPTSKVFTGVMLTTVASTLFFRCVYHLLLPTAPRHLDEATAVNWAVNGVSTLHSLIVVPLAYVAMDPFWDVDEVRLTTEASNRVIEIFLGYTLADSLPLLWYRNEWVGSNAYIGHHLAALAVGSVTSIRGHAHGLVMGLLLCEATAPFVNARWFLLILSHKNSPLYVINGILMAVSFFVLRIVLMGGLFVYNEVYLHASFFTLPPSTVAILLLGSVIGYSFQILWFHKIVCGLVKALSVHM